MDQQQILWQRNVAPKRQNTTPDLALCYCISVSLSLLSDKSHISFSRFFFYRKATTNLLLRLAGKKGKKFEFIGLMPFHSVQIKLLILVKSSSSIFFLPAIFFSLEQQHYKRDVQTRAEEGKRNGRKTRLKREKWKKEPKWKVANDETLGKRAYYSFCDNRLKVFFFLKILTFRNPVKIIQYLLTWHVMRCPIIMLLACISQWEKRIPKFRTILYVLVSEGTNYHRKI